MSYKRTKHYRALNTKNLSPKEQHKDFIWSLFFPAPDTGRWRITGIEVDGKAGIEVEVFMECSKQIHRPGFNMCRVCGENHALPKATDQRYAYRWYPMLPSLKSVMQWNRRNWEREVREALATTTEPPEPKLTNKRPDSTEVPLTEEDIDTWNKLREKFWFGITK